MANSNQIIQPTTTFNNIEDAIKTCLQLQQQLKQVGDELEIQHTTNEDDVANLSTKQSNLMKELTQSEQALYAILFDPIRANQIAQHEDGIYTGANAEHAFGPYIIYVLRQMTPASRRERFFSNSLMGDLNKILLDLRIDLWKITNELFNSADNKNERDQNPDFLVTCVQKALLSKIPGNLGKHAVSMGVKSLYIFAAATKNKNQTPSKKAIPIIIDGSVINAYISPFSRSIELVFPIYHQMTNLVDRTDVDEVTQRANIYVASILEYLTAELTELLEKSASKTYDAVFLRHHLENVLLHDDELNTLINGGITIKSAGKFI
jgi:hypothetical protein